MASLRQATVENDFKKIFITFDFHIFIKNVVAVAAYIRLASRA